MAVSAVTWIRVPSITITFCVATASIIPATDLSAGAGKPVSDDPTDEGATVEREPWHPAKNIPQTMLTTPTFTIFLMGTSMHGLVIRPRSPGQVVCHGDHWQQSDGGSAGSNCRGGVFGIRIGSQSCVTTGNVHENSVGPTPTWRGSPAAEFCICIRLFQG